MRCNPSDRNLTVTSLEVNKTQLTPVRGETLAGADFRYDIP